jgi:hypothetical protein
MSELETQPVGALEVGAPPAMSPRHACAVMPKANPRLKTRSIQPLRMAGKPTKYAGATKASACAIATLASCSATSCRGAQGANRERR